jgi:hypothetical protein
MNFRKISLIALPLIIGALAAWVFLRKERTYPSTIARIETASGATPAAASHTDHVHPAATPHAERVPTSSLTTPILDSARVTSSVVAGAPMVRTEATTPAPAEESSASAAAPASAANSPTSRPEPYAEAKTELEGVRLMLGNFRTRMGENPVGSNAEIMRSVMGENPVHANLGPPAGQSLNENGELVDRWGTPYFFHQLARDKMEIRSAGPDQRMWTSDDLITK